jgi:hypothetical protein
MPRGRPKGSKNIGPRLPKGGYRALMGKKRLADKVAAYSAMTAAMLSGANTQAAMAAPYKKVKGTGVRGRPRKTTTTVSVSSISQAQAPVRKSAFNRATPARRAAMLAGITDVASYKRRIGPSNKATPTQLASLAKARAARAAKKSGGIVAVAVAAPAQ